MDEDLQSASQGMHDMPTEQRYAPRPGKQPKKLFKKILIALGSLILLVFAGFAVWYFILNKPKSDNPAASTNQTSNKPSIPSDVPDTSATEEFKSVGLALTLTYPNTWKVTEAAGGVRVESPEFSYTTLTQGSVTGNFRIYIRKGAREVDGTYIGKGYAIKPSEKLTYTKPANNQRTDTLLSSFGYDDTDNFAFFMIAGNFPLVVGDTLGPKYGSEPDATIIVGGYSGKELTDDLNMHTLPPETYAQTNAYRQAVAIIQSLQLR